MCTNFALIKKDGTAKLARRLSVDENRFLFGSDFRPGSTISIVSENNGTRQVTPAVWWLYLRQTDTGLEPHQDYFSVNTNYKKLPRKHEYRRHRCIVPATAFVESQEGRKPHLLEPADGSAIAFGGLYKEWTDKVTGEIVTSASVITLPGHKALENIHRKSIPLWLPEEAYDDWLSPEVTDTARFAGLLEPALRSALTAAPIDKAMNKRPTGKPFVIPAA